MEKKDWTTKDSKYREAIMAVVLRPDSWGMTNNEIREEVFKFLKKAHGKRATRPGSQTVKRVIRHPDFQEELRTHRKNFLVRAMPSIERALVRAIVEDGDVRAYDRVVRATGEQMFSPESTIRVVGDEGKKLEDRDIEEALGRIAAARSGAGKVKVKKKKKKA